MPQPSRPRRTFSFPKIFHSQARSVNLLAISVGWKMTAAVWPLRQDNSGQAIQRCDREVRRAYLLQDQRMSPVWESTDRFMDDWSTTVGSEQLKRLYFGISIANYYKLVITIMAGDNE
jgi:hypothetical protein